MTGAMEKIKAKVENVLHKDKDTTHDTTTGTHSTHNDPTGPHSSHAGNKADPRVDSDHVGGIGNTTSTGGHGTTTGTHGSTGSGLTGTHNTHGTTGTHGLSGSDPTGPHDSHLGNKADPRVDSDRFGTAGNTTSAGGYGTTGTHGATGTHGTTGTGLTGSHNTHGSTGLTGSDPTGPHDSRLGNKADPRVDSDRYGAAGNTTGAGYGTTGSGLTGTHGTTGTHGITGHNTTGHNTTGHNTTHGSDPTGPHDSHLTNKLDPRVDSDRVGPAGNTAGASNTHGSHNTHGTSAGTGGKQHADFHKDSGRHTGNEPLPEALTEDKSRAGAHGGLANPHTEEHLARKSVSGNTGVTGSHAHGSDPTGPHDSHLGNKVDPRVDSDRYGAAGNTTSAGGYGTTGSGLTGSHNTHGTTGAGYGTTGSGLTGTHGTHGTTGSGLTGNTYGSDPTGPHDSRLGNKADPRVDSDRYGAAGNTTGAYGSTGSGLTGTHGTHGTTGSGLTGNTYGSDPTGPHDSRLGNQADPRVDSDRVGGAGNTYGTHQSGGLTGNNHPGNVGNPNASKTAGPHGSDMMNKLDPRVDSDLNGSKTVGGDKTYTN